jgi:LacI family transcriptional regulator
MAEAPKRVAIMLDLQWPYKRHASTFAGTQQFANEHGWHSIIDEFAHDTLPARRGQAVPYDGVIARANHELADRAKRHGIPVVNMWASSPVWNKLPGVFPDFEASGQLKAEHFLSRGLSNFAAMTAYKNRGERMEVVEFRNLLEQRGYDCTIANTPQSLSRSLDHWRRTKQLVEAWMDRWQLPIGVMVGGEDLGRLVVQMCHERGWRVPQDVAIIAGQNEENLCENPSPSMTSMEFGYERIGYQCAKLLQHLMNGGRAPKRPISLSPSGLVVRESTDFHAVQDKLVAEALDYISRNSHRHIGQHDVARAVNAETRTLQLRFRKYLDSPIATEIRRVRIERAKRELVQSDRRIEQIARDVGFKTANRMCEIFRRELGITPTDYRRERQIKSKT